MSETTRRDLLAMLGAGSMATMFGSIDRALAIPPAVRTGTIEDIEHIIILMQENRSFDHYFGTMKGIRGFDDPRAAKLKTGLPIWYQPAPATGGYLLPYRPDKHFGDKFLEDVDHGWQGGHIAFNGGEMDGWVAAKGQAALTHYIREDIPYHFALADAFTVCDNYFNSLIGPTDPNRYYMWTGWVGNDGKNGGPVVDNAEAGYDWMTFPERLQAAGISWKVYQDIGTGLDANGSWGWTSDPYIGNFGDNSLLYFHKYQNAAPGTPLYQAARTGTNISAGGTLFDEFKADVANNTLPQISYIAAPEAYSEHPNWVPKYGAWYISQMLDILTSNPDVWSKTALIITYDENGGFFDHVLPPTVPVGPGRGLSTVSTVNELYPGSAEYQPGPFGMCGRIPTLIVSPWSTGGWVNSQVFDHTSLIRFIERRFERTHPGLRETNITPWRRAVAGDLTSAFDFANPRQVLPKLPSTDAFMPPDHAKHPDYIPIVPVAQKMPHQEKGMRYSRPLPYQLDAAGRASLANMAVSIDFINDGTSGAVFQVRAAKSLFPPRSYTVEPQKRLSDSWQYLAGTPYDLTVHGPNGFFRQFRGAFTPMSTQVSVATTFDCAHCTLSLAITNSGQLPANIQVTDGYTGQSAAHVILPGATVSHRWSAAKLYGWYDLILTSMLDPAFRQQFAGRIETGQVSISDPAIGRHTAS